MNEHIINEDLLACSICLVQFGNENDNLPLSLKCGHTLCKKCVSDYQQTNNLICPYCKVKTEMQSKGQLANNNIILSTINLLNCLDINYSKLLKFSFFYCSTCNLFISNYTFLCHKIMKHKISSLQHNITEMYKLFFSVKSTNKDTYKHIALLFILNMFLHKKKKKMRRFSVKDYSGPNSNFFSFYGEEFKKKNINLTYDLIKYVLSNNRKVNAKATIHKGILIGKNTMIMQGYFLCNETGNTFTKGIGIVNTNEMCFFGLVDFYAQPTSSGFALEYGIYSDSTITYFGWFNNEIGEYPIYEFRGGEIIDEKRGKVARKEYSPFTNSADEIPETFKDNQFYKYNLLGEYDQIIFKKFNMKQLEYTINPDQIKMKFIEFYLCSKTKHVKNIKLIDEHMITITMNYNVYMNKDYDSIQIESNEIYLNQYNANIVIVSDKEEMKVFVYSNLDIDKTKSKGYIYGYLLTPKNNDTTERIKRISTMYIGELFEKFEDFKDSCNYLFESPISNYNILYQKLYINFSETPGENDWFFDRDTGIKEDITKNISFTLLEKNNIELKLNYQNRKRGKRKVISSKMHLCVKDILPHFYMKKPFEEKEDKEIMQMKVDLMNPSQRNTICCFETQKCLIF